MTEISLKRCTTLLPRKKYQTAKVLNFLDYLPCPSKILFLKRPIIFPENYSEIDPQVIESDSESEEQEKPVKIEEELSDEPCQVCGRKDNLQLVGD